MSIAQRISVLIEKAEKGKQASFSEKTGISASSVNSMLKNQANPRGDTIGQILTAYPTLNARWLITGEGRMWEAEEDVELRKSLEECQEARKAMESQLMDQKVLVENLNKLSAFLRADIDRMKKEQGFE